MTRVWLLAKNDAFGEMASEIVKSYFNATFVQLLDPGSKLSDLKKHRPKSIDLILSYCCPVILDTFILSRVNFALNFHPGPPKYPGIGGYNFALYNGDSMYGTVCHIMEKQVDTGAIIMCNEFYIADNDAVSSLRLKARTYLLQLLLQICTKLSADGLLKIPLDTFNKVADWECPPHTYSDLEELKQIHYPAMSTDEISKRVRASHYPGTRGAFIYAGGRRFYCLRS